MAVIHKRDIDEVLQKLSNVANEYGLTRTDRFIGAFIEYFANIYGESINDVYDLDFQTRIDTATGEYLDGYGVFLDEERSIDTLAQDLSLDNAYIQTSNAQDIANYTVGGEPIYIPSGTSIFDENNNEVMTTIDDVVTSSKQAYIRVQGLYGVNTLNPGIYTIDGSISDFSLTNDNDLDVNTSGIILPILQVVLQKPIVSSVRDLDDDTYRAVLYSKSRSINQLNKHKINTILSNANIAQFIIKEFSSGSSSITIYVEPTIGLLSKPLELVITQAINRIVPYGTVVHIARMVPSLVQGEFDITLVPNTPSSEFNNIILTVQDIIINNIQELPSGSNMNISNILPNINAIPNLSTIVVKDIYIHGDKIPSNNYVMQDIEYLYAVAMSIKVNII